MTSYWKPRWPHHVFFGSFREINYRIDLAAAQGGLFRLLLNYGPGFSLQLRRSPGPPGYHLLAPPPAEAYEFWLKKMDCQQALAELLREHFSLLQVSPLSLACFCEPAAGDLLPEGPQLEWCLSRLYLLWENIPASHRQQMPQSEFLS